MTTRMATLIFIASTSLANADERTLFDFREAADAQPWQTVNDGVMGGRSAGRFRINDRQCMEFYGNLSLANNGGFASVRARGIQPGLAPGEALVARVRGDGREYQFNVYTQDDLRGYSFRQSFTTKKGEWMEVAFPVERFVATWRGRKFPRERLDPAKIAGLGFLLGDKREGAFKLEVEWVKVAAAQKEPEFESIRCEGVYPHHLQGVCTGEQAIYWSFTTVLVKTDQRGKVLKKIPVANHHGDLCYHGGKLYVAVNLGKFNDPQGNADSWVYVYDASQLKELARHETQEVFHGAGGIGYRQGRFYVVGGLPDGVEENYVYEYDDQFKFVKKHTLKSGHTHLGIQTATFAHDRWWFGCYGDPKILLVTDANFQLKGRYELDCSLGIEGLSGDRLLVASGNCKQGQGCTGSIRAAAVAPEAGFRLLPPEK